MHRRVVVTGMGVLCPIGNNLQESWLNILNGRCAISKLEDPAYSNLPCRIAGMIKIDGKRLNLEEHFSKTELKAISPATSYALMATKEALTNATLLASDGLCTMSEEMRKSTGVAVGMGMVDLQDICNTNDALTKSYRQVSPFFVPRILANMAAGQISIKYGLQGPNHSVSTACATGAHAIGDSFRFIRNGDANIMVCGGAEASISPLAIAGFCRLRALSTSFNDMPEKASRPFDKKREGFVMGEGSAILVLEELEHAKQRGAHIHAEILGYGLSGDASHLTAPSSDGAGAILAMSRAIKDARITSQEIGYVNAHATSTPLGDTIETKAIKTVLCESYKNIAVSSTKGAHGHLLGAAGNLEAVFTIKCVEDAVFPPTVNLDEQDDNELNLVAKVKQSWEGTQRRIALKNAFGFGGTNASLCIAQYV